LTAIGEAPIGRSRIARRVVALPLGVVPVEPETSARGKFQPPLIITCAITGDHQQTSNPNLPVTLEEQVASAIEAAAAGASIIHIHGRQADDPTLAATDPARYREINDAIRAAVPGVLIDNTQMTAPLGGQLFAYSTSGIAARPDIMSLNPGPMTFRGGGTPSSALITTFDDTARAAEALRAHGIKPQVFIYHPGHLDILGELIERDLLAKPYFVQLVFGQQSGIAANTDAFRYMIQHLPNDCVFQACALGLASIELNLFAMLHGGHARTGMEDSLLYRDGELATGNRQLVERVARFSVDFGRRVATPAVTRTLLGMDA
jgi:3-keto-5-aminohexanoate cleavage enzyme